MKLGIKVGLPCKKSNYVQYNQIIVFIIFFFNLAIVYLKIVTAAVN